MALRLIGVCREALPQDEQQVDQELWRSFLVDQLGAGPDPGFILNQPRKWPDARIDRAP
jgi:hypothetical protein